MKKKLIAALLLCAMTASLFASCSGGDDAASSEAPSSAVTSSETASSKPESSKPESSEAESSEAASSEADEESEAASQTPSAPAASSAAPQPSQSPASSAAPAASVAVSTIVDAVKNAYGENYLPQMDLTAEDLEARYGIKADDCDEAAGQVAMISTQVDTFVAVKAKDGKADAVVAALNAYRDDLVNNSMQYPMNVPKVNASKVYQNGNYVFFIMLGEFSPEDADESAAVAFYEEQNQIAVNAIDSALAG